jgi:hypothetical protein
MIHAVLVFDSNRRTLGQRSGLAMGTEADQSGEGTEADQSENAGGGGGAAPAPPELPATGGPDVALETG